MFNNDVAVQQKVTSYSFLLTTPHGDVELFLSAGPRQAALTTPSLLLKGSKIYSFRGEQELSAVLTMLKIYATKGKTVSLTEPEHHQQW